jgi:hypothetical protein
LSGEPGAELPLGLEDRCLEGCLFFICGSPLSAFSDVDLAGCIPLGVIDPCSAFSA